EGDPKRRLSMKLGLVLGYTEEPDTLHRTKGAVAERLRIFTADRDRLPEGFVQNDLLKLGYALTYHETRAWGPLSLSQLQDLDRHLADYLVVGNIHNAGRNWIRLQPRSADTDSVYIIGSRTSEEIFPLHLIDEKAVTTLSESQNILKSSISAKPYTAETASVYFINTPGGHARVLKVMETYTDGRFKQSTLDDRQATAAAIWRRYQTHGPGKGVYGVNVYACTDTHIYMSEATADLNLLDGDAEWAILMAKLPTNQQLDIAMLRSTPSERAMYAHTVIRHIARSAQQYFARSSERAGMTDLRYMLSPGSLHNKLMRDLIGGISSEVLYGDEKSTEGWMCTIFDYLARKGEFACVEGLYQPIFREDDDPRDRYSTLAVALQQATKTIKGTHESPVYRKYMEERQYANRLIEGHGDLKASNLWVGQLRWSDDVGEWEINPDSDAEVTAIENDPAIQPEYYMVDDLSEVAMFISSLAIDNIVMDERERNQLVYRSVYDYLEYTAQNTRPSARAMMYYYLTHKAIVHAIVAFNFDNDPERGERAIEWAYRFSNRVQSYIDGTEPA